MALDFFLADSSAVAKNEELLRTRVREALEILNTDPASLSRIMGRGKDYVRDFLEGRKKTMDAISMQIIEREIREKAASRVLNRSVPSVEEGFRPPPELLGERDLPVYSAVEGGPGEMVVSTDPIEIVPRPWYMREVRDGYAVLVVGESMVPAFEPGDMAIVNPRLPPMRNKNTIFVTGEHGGRVGGEFRATIKRLLRWGADEWHVKQFNQETEFSLSRQDWPKALRVVGKYEG